MTPCGLPRAPPRRGWPMETTTPRAHCGCCACAGVAAFPLLGGLQRSRRPTRWRWRLPGGSGGPARAVRAMRRSRPARRFPARCGAPPTGAAAVRECAEGSRPLLGSGPGGRAAAAESAARPGGAWGSPGGSGYLAPRQGSASLLCSLRVEGAPPPVGSVGFGRGFRGFLTVREGERSLLWVVVSLAGHGSAVPVPAPESWVSLNSFLVNSQKGCVDKKSWKRRSEKIGVRLALGRGC